MCLSHTDPLYEGLFGLSQILELPQPLLVIIVVGIGKQINFVVARDERIGSRGGDNPGVCLIRIEENRTVDIPVRRSRIQIVEADKGADFRSLSNRYAVFNVEGAHIIKDDFQLLYFIIAKRFQSLDGF